MFHQAVVAQTGLSSHRDLLKIVRGADMRFSHLVSVLLLVRITAGAARNEGRAVDGICDAPPDLQVLGGFKLELVHSAGVGEGSWICMTFDSKGGLIISPQDV